MFNIVLAPGPRIEVQGKHHVYTYATDGSLPNPLESTYAALAGCAGVYAKKACRELGIADAGIAIGLRIVAKAGQPLMPSRIVTSVEFPAHFDASQREAVLRSIEKCAVTAVMQAGAEIDFTVEEALPA
ncbi:MAG TPA: OsmC family protein [Steroidobacteraceae bacterium]